MDVSTTQPADPFVERDLARIAEFRKEYRDRFAGKPYFGPFHALTIASIGAATLTGLIKGLRKPVKPSELAVVPATFLMCNIAEWFMHNYVMHVPRKGFFGTTMGIYRRHTLNHHQFFSRDWMTYENVNDYRIVLFPPYAILTSIALSAMPASILAAITKSRNAGLLFVATTTSMYLVYETFHYSCHLRENPVLKYIPFINTIRRHHAAHHDKRIMTERNLNLTFPIADWLFKTSDLDRGLLGHIFNGYSEKYVKPEFTAEGLRRETPAKATANV